MYMYVFKPNQKKKRGNIIKGSINLLSICYKGFRTMMIFHLFFMDDFSY